MTQTARKWDWRDVNGENWVSPTSNQGRCGSCVSFASIAAIEVHYRQSMNDPNSPVDLSEAGLHFTNRRCTEGWNIARALEYTVEEGICFEENYPYVAQDQPAQFIEGLELTYKLMEFDSTTDTRFDVHRNFDVY